MRRSRTLPRSPATGRASSFRTRHRRRPRRHAHGFDRPRRGSLAGCPCSAPSAASRSRTRYAIALAFAGIAVFAAVGALSHERERAFSASLIYLGLGLAAATIIDILGVRWIDPFDDATLIEHLAEFAVIVALFGTGLKLDRALEPRAWGSVARLLGIVMPLTIAAVALFGTAVMGLSLGAAIILGAVLAPTDPVLAGDVGVGPPGDEDERRAELRADGRGGPRTTGSRSRSCSSARTSRPRAASRLAGGVARGRRPLRRARRRRDRRARAATRSRRASCACASGGSWPRRSTAGSRSARCCSSTGSPRSPAAYGFLAAFAAGVAFRRYEHGHEMHRRVHDGAEVVEKFCELGLILLLGSLVTVSGRARGRRDGLAARARPAARHPPAGDDDRVRRLADGARRARVHRLVRRARHRIAVLRRGRARTGHPVGRRVAVAVLDRGGVRRRLDRRPRRDRRAAEPPPAAGATAA